MHNRKYSLNMLDELDLEVLCRHVPAHYQPTPRPIVMCVGALFDVEAATLRQFHHDAYHIPPHDTIVAACNTTDTPVSARSADGFDYAQFGWMNGDARRDLTWMGPLMKTKRVAYDLSSIRNPDLVRTHEWADVFGKALIWTLPSGVVITQIKSHDAHLYTRLLAEIEARYDVRPVFSGVTGVGDEDDPFENDYHTIGIFQGRHGTELARR